MKPENHEFGVPCKMVATRLPVNRNHGNICGKSDNIYLPKPQSTLRSWHLYVHLISLWGWHVLDLEYQDGAGGFKILLAEYIVCVIQYYSDQWICHTDLPWFALINLPVWIVYEALRCWLRKYRSTHSMSNISMGITRPFEFNELILKPVIFIMSWEFQTCQIHYKPNSWASKLALLINQLSWPLYSWKYEASYISSNRF